MKTDFFFYSKRKSSQILLWWLSLIFVNINTNRREFREEIPTPDLTPLCGNGETRKFFQNMYTNWFLDSYFTR